MGWKRMNTKCTSKQIFQQLIVRHVPWNIYGNQSFFEAEYTIVVKTNIVILQLIGIIVIENKETRVIIYTQAHQDNSWGPGKLQMWGPLYITDIAIGCADFILWILFICEIWGLYLGMQYSGHTHLLSIDLLHHLTVILNLLILKFQIFGLIHAAI